MSHLFATLATAADALFVPPFFCGAVFTSFTACLILASPRRAASLRRNSLGPAWTKTSSHGAVRAFTANVPRCIATRVSRFNASPPLIALTPSTSIWSGRCRRRMASPICLTGSQDGRSCPSSRHHRFVRCSCLSRHVGVTIQCPAVDSSNHTCGATSCLHWVSRIVTLQPVTLRSTAWRNGFTDNLRTPWERRSRLRARIGQPPYRWFCLGCMKRSNLTLSSPLRTCSTVCLYAFREIFLSCLQRDAPIGFCDHLRPSIARLSFPPQRTRCSRIFLWTGIWRALLTYGCAAIIIPHPCAHHTTSHTVCSVSTSSSSSTATALGTMSPLTVSSRHSLNIGNFCISV